MLSNRESIRIRPHHLNCLPRFVGKGYSADFCENMKKIKERIDGGEKYTVVFGADDVCKCCPNLVDGICRDEEKVSVFDRLSVKEKDIEKICFSCRWFDICKNL